MSHIIVFIFKSVLVDIKPLPAFLLVHICLESHFFNLSYPCISNIIIVSNLSSSITLLFNPRVCLLNSEFNLLILFLLLSCRCFFMFHFYLPCFFVCVFLLFYLFWLSKFLNQFESYIFSLCYSYLYSIKTYIQIFSHHYQAEVFKSQHRKDAQSCGLSPGRSRVLSAGHVAGSGGSDQGKAVPAPPWPQAVSTLQDVLTWRQHLSCLRLISSRPFIGKQVSGSAVSWDECFLLSPGVNLQLVYQTLTFALMVLLNPARISTPSSPKQRRLKCSGFEGIARRQFVAVFTGLSASRLWLSSSCRAFHRFRVIRRPGFFQPICRGSNSQEGCSLQLHLLSVSPDLCAYR